MPIRAASASISLRQRGAKEFGLAVPRETERGGVQGVPGKRQPLGVFGRPALRDEPKVELLGRVRRFYRPKPEWPRCARCTRSWCSRPVWARTRNRVAASPIARRQNSVRAAAPRAIHIIRHATTPCRSQIGFVGEIPKRASGASICPVAAETRPRHHREVLLFDLAGHRHGAEPGSRFGRTGDQNSARWFPGRVDLPGRGTLSGYRLCSLPSSVGRPSGRVGWERRCAGLTTTRNSGRSATSSTALGSISASFTRRLFRS